MAPLIAPSTSSLVQVLNAMKKKKLIEKKQSSYRLTVVTKLKNTATQAWKQDRLMHPVNLLSVRNTAYISKHLKNLKRLKNPPKQFRQGSKLSTLPLFRESREAKQIFPYMFFSYNCFWREQSLLRKSDWQIRFEIFLTRHLTRTGCD